MNEQNPPTPNSPFIGNILRRLEKKFDALASQNRLIVNQNKVILDKVSVLLESTTGITMEEK